MLARLLRAWLDQWMQATELHHLEISNVLHDYFGVLASGIMADLSDAT